MEGYGIFDGAIFTALHRLLDVIDDEVLLNISRVSSEMFLSFGQNFWRISSTAIHTPVAREQVCLPGAQRTLLTRRSFDLRISRLVKAVSTI